MTALTETEPVTSVPDLSPADAPLPMAYERARTALEECSQVDECKDWADKAQAIASYARQANDDGLYVMARRIQGRAVRRMGELLKPFQATNQHEANARGGDSPSTQRQAAESAGLSKDQEKQAVRVANVPEEEFEAVIESPSPPSVTALSEMGRKRRNQVTELSSREGYYEATHTMGAMRRFAERCDQHAPELVAGGLNDHELAEARSLVDKLDSWLDRFVTNLRRSA